MYQYNFLPFGLHVSSGLFQSAIVSVIKRFDGVLANQDDVLIFGLNKKEHDARLTQLLERFAARNVAIKPSKCVWWIPQVLVMNNGSQFCATEMKLWMDSIGCRHLRTAPRDPCSNEAAKHLVKMVKNATASANPKTLTELETLVDNFLLQYRNTTHTTTKEGSAMLRKFRRLGSSLQCLDSSDVVYFRRNDLLSAFGIFTRQLGQVMVEITDLNDATVHKRHVDQS
ncbi:unnamed protein product [Echinostoma caproni]|uniref:Reverse transcriptase domain-containing protein n=1 Tax=Echinostoma caproni TaxID=27848 RepID=A0A183APP6_9TREM|nr:unnamed protein product [Echinostoma caproni]